MPPKITAKNLQYNQNLPPFLARLRGGQSDRDGPDPILAAHRRPVKKRSASTEAEDAPLVVDEHGHALGGVSVAADGTVTEKEISGDVTEETGGEKKEVEGNESAAGVGQGGKLAGIGEMRKKRKIGRVVGAGADDEEEAGKPAKGGEKNKTTAQDAKDKDKAKAKKKAKKVKLSFGEDEG
ncbi:hypothetical protein C8A05DRAFT_33325 [Staphylotrichum tortipilum]|uniref:DUF4604 domain-containing protein n=1 Tax=Staphylotrichum tortipilum TaxID=2831512 RepID=A0AAN6MMG0_9PEZI|nr:hypothetical protein C8A05DRAFT_33325 [Staphylotrichum longicolle]